MMSNKDAIAKEFNKSSLSINEDDHEHGKHPNSLKNLKKWEKGETGNPIGRPLKYAKIKQELMALGKEITNDYYGKPLGTRKEQVLKKLWAKAIKGDIQFIKILIFLGVFDGDNS